MPNAKKALSNPVIFCKHKVNRRQTKLLDINFLLTGKLNGAHAVLIYISLILKFSCKKKYHCIFHDKVFSADMPLKSFVMYLKESFLNVHNVAFDYRLWIRRTDFSRDDNNVFINDVAAIEKVSENVNTTSYVESNWVLIPLPKFYMKIDVEKSVDLGGSFSDNLMQNPQTRLYEVCKQLISVDEDVCKLQNEYAEPIFEILIECWKPEALTSATRKTHFLKEKCAL